MAEDQGVATRSLAYNRMEARRRVARAFLEGTRGVRQLGEEVFPRKQGETSQDYEKRLEKRTFIRPYFQEAVDDLEGQAFEKPILLNEDVPLEIRGQKADAPDKQGVLAKARVLLARLLQKFGLGALVDALDEVAAELSGTEEVEGISEDIDLQGRDLTQFSRFLFRDGWTEGMSLFLVDWTTRDSVPNPTRADDGKGRAFWIWVPANAATNIRSHHEGGRLVVDELRVEEKLVEGEHQHQESTRYRRLVRGNPAITNLQDDARYALVEFYRKNERDEWVLSSREGEQPVRLKPHVEIPIVPYYPGKFDAPFEAYPQLETLLWLCIEHAQKKADFDEYFSFVKNRILFGTGFDEGTVNRCVNVGGNALWYTTNSKEVAGLTSVEQSGEGVTQAMLDQERLEAEISRAGLQPMQRKQAQTLGEKIIDTTKANSQLAASMLALKDSIEQGLYLTAVYYGYEAGGTASVHIPKPLPPSDHLESLHKARAGSSPAGGEHWLSLETYWEALKRHQVLGEEFSAEEEKQRLAVERRGSEVDDAERRQAL